MSLIRRAVPILSVVLILALLTQMLPPRREAKAEILPIGPTAPVAPAPTISQSITTPPLAEVRSGDVVPAPTGSAPTQAPPNVVPVSDVVVKTSVDVDPTKDTDLVSSSGKVNLHVPAGALATSAKIELAQHSAAASSGMKIINLFELNAKNTATGTSINSFAKGLTIQLKHDPRDLAGIDTDSLRLFYLDENGNWVPLADSFFDPKTLTLTASTTHFTMYGEQANPEVVGPGQVLASQVSLSSGTATFSYPLDLPPGPAGFKPKIELSYNSGAVDGMKNKMSLGSWVGIGWDLKLGRVSYDAGSGSYSLDLQGASYKLASLDGANFVTNPDEHLKVSHSGNTWDVYDTSGIHYRFGGTSDSEQYQYESYIPGSLYYAWDLNRITDTNGNQATITYSQDIVSSTVRAAYPQSLTYGGVQVLFNSSALRPDDPQANGSNPAPKIMDTRRLDSIEMKMLVTGIYTLVRRYEFAYNTTPSVYSSDYSGIYYAGKHTLTSVTEIGADGSSQLPSLSVTYTDLQIYRKDSVQSTYTGNPGNPADLTWPYLATLSSGYGGSVTFTYSESPDATATDIWTREVVTSKTISPGIGPDETRSYTYTDGPMYYGTGWGAEYRGFGQVTETDAAGNYVVHSYYTTGDINGQDADKLTGKEYQTQSYDGGDVLLRQTSNTWAWTATNQNNSNVISFGVDGRAINPSASNPIIGQQFSYYDNTGSYLGTSTLCAPQANAITGSSIYVADTGNNRIVVFGTDGRAISPYMSTPFIGPQFSYYDNAGGYLGTSTLSQPQALMIMGSSLYVADTGHDRIVVFGLDGRAISQYLTTPFIGPQFSYYDNGGGYLGTSSLSVPKAIAASGTSIYLADTGNNRVVVFGVDGRAMSQYLSIPFIGPQFNYYDSSGNYLDKTTLSSPQSIVFSGSSFYLADTGNSRLVVFGVDGRAISQYLSVPFIGPQFDYYDSSGTKLGSSMLANPQANVIVGSSIYVSDTGNSRLAVFGVDGRAISSYLSTPFIGPAFSYYNSSGTLLGTSTLVVPVGAAVDGSGYIWVTQGMELWSVHLDQVDTTEGAKTSRTRYSYDSYGNTITEYDDGDTGTNADDATIWRAYYPNTTANILNKTARERVYATAMSSDSGGANLRKETDYYYDGNNSSLSAQPTKGNLTRTQQFQNAASSVSTYSTYDTYGNRITDQDANGNVTTWTFEGTYNTYPASKTLALPGQSESYTYDPGTENLLSKTDLNGGVTNYAYDTFKRLTKTFKPGNDPVGDDPDFSYHYNSWGTLNSQNLETVTRVDATHSLSSKQFFDGVGRVVQTQSSGETEGGVTYVIIGKTTAYNAVGSVDREYISQKLDSATVSGYQAPGASWKCTSYAYDGLGRVTSQTAPDGTTARTDFSVPWQTTATNPMGAQTLYTYDAFKRLTSVADLSVISVTTGLASGATSTAGTLNGQLNSLGTATSVSLSFEYGATSAYGSTAAATPSSLTNPGTFSASLSGLTSNSIYHFRAKAVSGSMTVYGADQTLSTGGRLIRTSIGSNGSISPSGDVVVTSGNNQAFTISPSAGYHVADVLVDGASVGAVTSYTFNNVAVNHVISATFAPTTFAVTASATPSGGGTVTPSGVTTLGYNGSQAYTITPATGYVVSDVVIDGTTHLGAVDRYTFSNVTADHTIAVTSSGTGWYLPAAATGNFTSVSNGAASDNAYASTSTAGNYATYYNFSIPSILAGATVNGIEVAVEGYKAGGSNKTLDIALSWNTGTNYTTAKNIDTGTTQDVNTLAGGSNDTWGRTWSASEFTNTNLRVKLTAVNATGAVYVDAVKIKVFTSAFTISASVNGSGGNISPSGNTQVNSGGSQSYTITPDANHVVSDVVVDGTTHLGIVDRYTFSNVITDHTIAATFDSGNWYAPSGATGNFTSYANGEVSDNTYASTATAGNYVAYNTFTLPTIPTNNTISGIEVSVEGYKSGGSDKTLDVALSWNGGTTYTSAKNSGDIGTTQDNTITIGGSSDTWGRTWSPSELNTAGYLRVKLTAVNANGTIYVDSVKVRVTYSYITRAINATIASPGGTIAPAGTSIVDNAGSKSYTVSAASGFIVSDVKVDGSSVGAMDRYAFSNVTADHSISATFDSDWYTPSGNIGTLYYPENGMASDNAYAYASAAGNYATYSNFGIPAIPTGATINGIEVSIEGYKDGGSNKTLDVTLSWNGGTTYTSAINSGDIGTAQDKTLIVGGPTQSWGRSWASSEFTNANLRVKLTAVNATGTIYFDAVRIKVLYTANTSNLVASVSPTSGGSLSPAGTTVVSSGGSQAYSVSPAAGYVTSDVVIDGSTHLGAVDRYSFSNVTANHTIAATFDGASWYLPGTSAGNFTSVANGYTSDNTYASTSTAGNYATYYSFGIPSLPTGATINGIKVAVEGYKAGGSNKTLDIALSWNAGTTYTTAKNIDPGTTQDVTTIAGNATDTWGRTWAPTEFSNANLRVKLTAVNATGAVYVDAVSIKVVYTYPQYALDAWVVGSGGTISPAGNTMVDSNGSQAYTISPSAHSIVTDVIVDGSDLGGLDRYTFSSVAANHTIALAYDGGNWYSPTAATGNFTTPTYGYTSNNTYASTATAGNYATYYNFSIPSLPTGATINGIEVAVEGYKAGGSNKTLDVTLSWDAGTTYSSAKNVDPGTTQDKTVVAGGIADTWGRTWAIGDFTNANLRVKLTAVNATGTIYVDAVSIKVLYTPSNYTLSASVNGGGGDISPLGDTVVASGANQAYTITPAAGYVISDILIDGTTHLGGLDRYTFSNITANHSIVVTFDGAGWLSPTSYTGNFTSPTYGYTSNNTYAYTSTAGNYVSYYNFSVPTVPGGATINGIEVAVEGYKAGGSNKTLDVSLSWDGGTTFTSAKNSGDIGTTQDKILILGGNSDTWGRSWSPGEFSNANLRVKLTAVNATAAIYVDAVSFKVLYHDSGAPSVATSNASGITANSSTLWGNLSDLGGSGTVQVSFQYGTTASYGTTTGAQTLATNGDFSAVLSGLQVNTLYHFRAKAIGSGTSYGSDMTFVTPASPGGTTQYTYDTLGNLVQVVDAKGNITIVNYDWLSHKVSMADPDMGLWSYGFDANGSLVSQTDARGTVLTFTYDALNRLTSKKNGGSTLASYSYDDTTSGNEGLGMRTGMTDAAGTDSYVYNALGQNTREDRVIDGNTYTTQYTYDGAGRVATITYPTGEVVTQGYNGRGLPNFLSTDAPRTLVSSALYNQLGAADEIDLGNGLKTVFGYVGISAGDAVGYYGKLYSIQTLPQAGGTSVLDHQYQWDANGNLIARTDNVASETELFYYDSLDRLTGVGGPYIESFMYDSIGNITSMNGSTYAYGTAKPHAVTTVGAYNQGYDGNGNMASRANAIGTQTLTFDAENRLSQVQGTGGGYTGTATYVYDGDGKRIEKNEGGNTIVYPNKYYEKNVTTSDVTSYYFLGDQLVATKKNTTLQYVHQDSLESSSVATDSSGSSVSTIKYFSFGGTRSATGTLNTDMKYTGQRLDGTGLYFYNARYYDPVIGRFISPDSTGQKAEDPQTFNRYSYVDNNPLTRNDPSGHFGLSSLKDFGKGMVKAVTNTAKATAQMVVNPVQTAEALGYAVTHPVETAKAIGASYASKAGSAEGIGEIVGDIAIMALGGVGGAAAGKVVAKVAEVVRGAEVAAEAATEGAAISRGVIVQRAMSLEEAQSTLETGLLRGGREGIHYVSTNVSQDAAEAQQMLALKQMPDILVTMRAPEGVFSDPSMVLPKYGMPGGGIEMTATGQVPVEVLDWWLYI